MSIFDALLCEWLRERRFEELGERLFRRFALSLGVRDDDGFSSRGDRPRRSNLCASRRFSNGDLERRRALRFLPLGEEERRREE